MSCKSCLFNTREAIKTMVGHKGIIPPSQNNLLVDFKCFVFLSFINYNINVSFTFTHSYPLVKTDIFQVYMESLLLKKTNIWPFLAYTCIHKLSVFTFSFLFWNLFLMYFVVCCYVFYSLRDFFVQFPNGTKAYCDF